MKKTAVVLTALSVFFLLNSLCFGQYRIEFVPGISVGETYDDNIFLSNSNETSDYITRVSPSLSFGVVGQNTRLQLSYVPTFNWYADRDDLNYTSHSANLSLEQGLTQHLRFRLTDTYLRSEDPLDDIADVQGQRRTRNTYWTNLSRASLDYLFGAENRVVVDYGLAYRENDAFTLDDSKVQDPFAMLTYWFDVRNGIELKYQYLKADFSRDEGLRADDDFTGNKAGLRYIRRFSPQSRAYAGYNYTTRNFDGLTEDFNIHDGSVGLEHSFSPEYSVAVGAGYFIRVNDTSDNQKGPIYSASLTRNFARGSIIIGGAGGWDEEYLTVGTDGFTKYYSGYARAQYQVLEPVSIYAGASYRHDKSQTDRRWVTLRGNCGLRWSFLRWFYLNLDYTHADRNDDVNTEDYKVNRVTLSLGATKPYIW